MPREQSSAFSNDESDVVNVPHLSNEKCESPHEIHWDILFTLRFREGEASDF
jgi:hypothetical protein